MIDIVKYLFQMQYKYANIACEVLTSDISFAEKICAAKSFMDKLFHFFRDAGATLNPVLASYVCRTLGEIVTRNLDQVIIISIVVAV